MMGKLFLYKIETSDESIEAYLIKENYTYYMKEKIIRSINPCFNFYAKMLMVIFNQDKFPHKTCN